MARTALRTSVRDLAAVARVSQNVITWIEADLSSNSSTISAVRAPSRPRGRRIHEWQATRRAPSELRAARGQARRRHTIRACRKPHRRFTPGPSPSWPLRLDNDMDWATHTDPRAHGTVWPQLVSRDQDHTSSHSRLTASLRLSSAGGPSKTTRQTSSKLCVRPFPTSLILPHASAHLSIQGTFPMADTQDPFERVDTPWLAARTRWRWARSRP